MTSSSTETDTDRDQRLRDAVAARDIASVVALCGEGGNPSAKDVGGCTALHLAMEDECPLEIAKHLLHQPGVQVTVCDVRGRTPLHHALDHRLGQERREITERLLGCGADPNAQDDLGNAPFFALNHARMFEGEIALIDFLKAQGAHLDLQNNVGHNMLEDAIVSTTDLEAIPDPKGWLRLMRHLLSTIGLNIDPATFTGEEPFEVWFATMEATHFGS